MSQLIKPTTLAEYAELRQWLDSLRESGQIEKWGEAMRWYALNDLFFFVNEVMSDGRHMHSEYDHPFYWHERYVQYCRDVEWQAENGGGIDASGRGSGKSTVRTKAFSIQQMLKHPDIAICIFSFTKDAAKRHFVNIMDELQKNKLLYALFPDVLYEDPQEAAINSETTWSKTDGSCC